MAFTPHTPEEVQSMLAATGVSSLDALFDEIPADLRQEATTDPLAALNEMEMLRWMADKAETSGGDLVCFAGAGCYDHHIPAAVWDLAARGEFMTAYTPYQAEASQGTLQLLFEYQTMMSELTGLDVSNASVYDGASGLAEAIAMAVRAQARRLGVRRILVAGTLHPRYRAVAETILKHQGVTLDVLPMGDGLCDPEQLPEGEPIAALVLQNPNFFGNLEDVDALTDRAHAAGALVIAVVNPLTLAVLKPPGAWGQTGADIACGDGQPLGAPMSSGGPSFGFICTRMKLVRQLPGRLIGKTEDRQGREGYTLTLQAREQHIRRGKATSNICTNQGLMVTAAAIHTALLGAQGLADAALASHARTRDLVNRLSALPGVQPLFPAPWFHECALALPKPAGGVIEAALAHGYLPGVDLGRFFPGMDHGLLVCATEKRSAAEIDRCTDIVREALA